MLLVTFERLSHVSNSDLSFLPVSAEIAGRPGSGEWRVPMMQVSSAFVADPDLVLELEKRAKPVVFGRDRVLFHQGDKPKGVYILKKGAAILTNMSDGDALLKVEAGPGSLLGVPAVVGAKPYSLTVEAVEGAEVSVLTVEDFVRLMHTEPTLSFRVLQVLAEEVRFAREALASL